MTKWPSDLNGGLKVCNSDYLYLLNYAQWYEYWTFSLVFRLWQWPELQTFKCPVYESFQYKGVQKLDGNNHANPLGLHLPVIRPLTYQTATVIGNYVRSVKFKQFGEVPWKSGPELLNMLAFGFRQITRTDIKLSICTKLSVCFKNKIISILCLW